MQSHSYHQHTFEKDLQYRGKAEKKRKGVEESSSPESMTEEAAEKDYRSRMVPDKSEKVDEDCNQQGLDN